MEESGTVRDEAYKNTKMQKLLSFVKEYGSVDVQASAIKGYTKKLEDAMTEFQVSLTFIAFHSS